jgi:hypothetical protein
VPFYACNVPAGSLTDLRAGDEGPSVPIIVEPLKQPTEVPAPPAPREPVREPEKVPA